MPSSGFGMDLYQLDRVAKHDLPTIANVYDEAIANLQSAESIPNAPAEFDGANGSVRQDYGSLHTAVTGILKSTRTSLEETADALAKAVQLYAETDQSAANRLQELYENRGKHTPEPERNPESTR